MRFLCSLVAGCFVGTGLVAAPAHAGGGSTITEIVAASGDGFDSDFSDFDILLKAVVTAELDGALADTEVSYTVFAPDDLAFLRLARDLGFGPDDDTFDTREESVWNFLVGVLATLDPEGNPVNPLTDVLLYHVTFDDVAPVDLLIRTFLRSPIETLQGGTFQPRFFRLVDNDPDAVDPRVKFPLNIQASNGRIHTINRVLRPIDLP